MNPVTGVWERNSEFTGSVGGETIDIPLAISKDLADAAVLYKIEKGLRLLVEQIFWEIVTGFTGGTSSAIGLSASVAPHTTKGDLLGGAAGDVAATLVAGVRAGTLGVSFSADPKLVVLDEDTEIRFDRITSAFTAGAGYVHIIGRSIR
jgi:hypothetical protein